MLTSLSTIVLCIAAFFKYHENLQNTQSLQAKLTVSGLMLWSYFYLLCWFLANVVGNHLRLCSDASPPPPPLSENAKGFLATLEHSSEEELTLHLQDRMQFSKEAIACLVCVFDRLHSRIDNMCKQVQAAGNCGDMLVTDTFIYEKSKWHINYKEEHLQHILYPILKLIICCKLGFICHYQFVGVHNMSRVFWHLLVAL